MKRTVLAAVVALAAMTAPLVSACAREPEEQLIYTEDDDAEVLAATAEARKTLPIFWAKFEAKPAGYDHFAVKVGLKTSAGNEEHIWMDGLGRANGKVTGKLANEPYDLPGLKEGSLVEVDEAAVSDWQYSKGGKLYGHFTTRALSARANAAQRAQAAELFSPQPLEAGTN
ncbi:MULTISPECIES: YegJ family protein [Phenylobacterium]|uniref:Uncharacterized protein YegJ (DUF2314 family) n=1 Tax=Phenylobacterium koreense TaxID=266125 RepID=A0ABV2ED25_9CAUL